MRKAWSDRLAERVTPCVMLLVALQLACARPAEAQVRMKDSSVELLDPGEAPRRALRYRPQIGHSERFVIQIVAADMATVDGRAMISNTQPSLRMAFALEATEAHDEWFGLVGSVESLEPLDDNPPVSQDLMRRMSEGVVGAEVRVAFTSSGLPIRGEARAPKSDDGASVLLQYVIRALTEAVTPTPTTPVGLGASWRVEQDVDLSGVPSRIEITYTVERIDEASVDLVMRLEQGGEPQRLVEMEKDLGLDEGMSAHLRMLKGEGGGRLRLVRGEIYPRWAVHSAMSLGEIAMRQDGAPARVMETTLMRETSLWREGQEPPSPELIPEGEPGWGEGQE